VSDPKLAREIVRELLLARSPELGARLKQLLNAELLRRGLEPFEERAHGFRKFSDFLESSQDWELLRADGPGDLRVALRSSPPSSVSRTTSGTSQPRIRNDVWQAFTNPDPARRRFFNRRSADVVHFLVDDTESRFRQEVERAPSDFTEVVPVEGEEQLDWMRQFIAGLPVAPAYREALGRMAEGPYSSQLNAAFTASLGEHSPSWRRHRSGMVFSRIEKWAASNSVAVAQLYDVEASPPAALPAGGLAAAGPGGEPARHDDAGAASRARIVQLLDMLPVRDLDDVVLPLVLSLLWTSSRRPA
jgi:hypothetical protein